MFTIIKSSLLNKNWFRIIYDNSFLQWEASTYKYISLHIYLSETLDWGGSSYTLPRVYKFYLEENLSYVGICQQLYKSLRCLQQWPSTITFLSGDKIVTDDWVNCNSSKIPLFLPKKQNIHYERTYCVIWSPHLLKKQGGNVRVKYVI